MCPQAANAARRKNSPKGYSLDEEHRPHISVMGGYVYTAIPLKEIGLGGIVVEPTPDMMRLQRKLIAALAPFMSPTGTDAAYAKTPGAPVEVKAEDVQLLMPRARRVKDASTRW